MAQALAVSVVVSGAGSFARLGQASAWVMSTVPSGFSGCTGPVGLPELQTLPSGQPASFSEDDPHPRTITPHRMLAASVRNIDTRLPRTVRNARIRPERDPEPDQR